MGEAFDLDALDELRAWAQGQRGAWPKMPDPLPDNILTNEAYQKTKPDGDWFAIWADDGKMYWFANEPIKPSWRERLYGDPDVRVVIEDRGLVAYAPPEVM